MKRQRDASKLLTFCDSSAGSTPAWRDAWIAELRTRYWILVSHFFFNKVPHADAQKHTMLQLLQLSMYLSVEGPRKIFCLFMNSWDSDVVGDHNQLTANSLEKVHISSKRRYIQDNKNKLQGSVTHYSPTVIIGEQDQKYR